MYTSELEAAPAGSTTINDFWGDALSTVSKVVPDSIQAEGQKILDSVTGGVKEAVSSVTGSQITGALTQAAQSGIEAARGTVGLTPTNPERTPRPAGPTPTTAPAAPQSKPALNMSNTAYIVGASTTAAMGAYGMYKRVGALKTILLSLAGGVGATILTARFTR